MTHPPLLTAWLVHVGNHFMTSQRLASRCAAVQPGKPACSARSCGSHRPCCCPPACLVALPHLQWVGGMKLAAKKAVELGKPWVLDPVGCGATPYRTQVGRNCCGLDSTRCSCCKHAGACLMHLPLMRGPSSPSSTPHSLRPLIGIQLPPEPVRQVQILTVAGWSPQSTPWRILSFFLSASPDRCPCLLLVPARSALRWCGSSRPWFAATPQRS